MTDSFRPENEPQTTSVSVLFDVYPACLNTAFLKNSFKVVL